MTRLTVGSDLHMKLRALSEATELRDEAGQVLGFYYPASDSNQANQVAPPFTQEEINRRRQGGSGRPLADILKDLGAQ